MEQKGFFGALFDFSFDNFITPKLVKVLYILVLALIALGFVVGMITGLLSLLRRGGFLMGVATIVLTPFVTAVYIIVARVSMEITVVIFRIAENIATIARRS